MIDHRTMCIGSKKETSVSIPSTDIRQRSRYREHEMGGTQSEVYKETVAETESNVKKNNSRRYSLSEEPFSKKNVASDLRAILERGGSTQKLRRYVVHLADPNELVNKRCEGMAWTFGYSYDRQYLFSPGHSEEDNNCGIPGRQVLTIRW